MVGRRQLFALGLILLVSTGTIIAGMRLYGVPEQQTQSPRESKVLKTDGGTYTLEMAASPESQEKGLGRRDSLPAEAGMIFPYPAAGERCFWMKDMRFPIDMIWVNASKKITRIEPNVSPDTYPRTYCYAAQYVIELNAGEAEKSNLRSGQSLDF